MEQSKCPECGAALRRRAKKCRNCGADVVVCSECGSAYKKGVADCDMCGRKFEKCFIKRRREAYVCDNSAPNDLVSVINDVKTQNVGYKILRVIRGVCAVVFWMCLALSATLGLMLGEAPADLAISIIRGNSFAAVWELFITTIPRNFNIWKDFIVDIAGNEITVSVLLRFLNYIIASLLLPVLTVTAYCSFVYIPFEIAENIVCGLAAKKRGYSATDTVAVFERPTLIYNSDDSFDKAYTYFPFTEKIKGRIGSVIAHLIFHAANLSYCILAIGIFLIQAVTKIAIWSLFGGSLGLEAMYLLLTVIVLVAVLAYIVIAIIIGILSNVISNAIHKRRLDKWSKMIF